MDQMMTLQKKLKGKIATSGAKSEVLGMLWDKQLKEFTK